MLKSFVVIDLKLQLLSSTRSWTISNEIEVEDRSRQGGKPHLEVTDFSPRNQNALHAVRVIKRGFAPQAPAA
jgi:hypothetical protein